MKILSDNDQKSPLSLLVLHKSCIKETFSLRRQWCCCSHLLSFFGRLLKHLFDGVVSDGREQVIDEIRSGIERFHGLKSIGRQHCLSSGFKDGLMSSINSGTL